MGSVLELGLIAAETGLTGCSSGATMDVTSTDLACVVSGSLRGSMRAAKSSQWLKAEGDLDRIICKNTCSLSAECIIV